MYLPPIITSLLPFLLSPAAQVQDAFRPPVPSQIAASTTSSATTLSFRPAHAHATKQDASRQLLFHDGRAHQGASIVASSSSSAGRRHRLKGAQTASTALYDASEDVAIRPLDALLHGEATDDGRGPPLVVRTARKRILRPRVTVSNSSADSLQLDNERARHRRPGLLEYGRASRRRQSAATSAWAADEFDAWSVDWVEEEADVPDVTDRETLIALAKMTSNAYTLPMSSDWYPLDEDGFNRTRTVPFGWDKDADGLRGHVFVDEQNTTAIISIKGTSAGVLGSGGPTAKNDKFNDNLLFSCCCARVDFSWSPVCDCFAGGYKCEQKCLEQALLEESAYTSVGPNLYHNVTRLYPNATVWLVGHSLGGSLASLLGLSYGRPAVTFEAPGERLAAARLHLPLPPEKKRKKQPERNATASFDDPGDAKVAITHVYHNADPIPMGVCNGPYSGCYALGFAMESRCHTGESIVYDVIGRKGWSVDIRTHRIGEVINRVLDEDWDPPPNDTTRRVFVDGRGSGASSSWWPWWPRGNGTVKPNGTEPDDEPPKPTERNPNAVPRPEREDDCVDCFRWEFGNGMKKDPTTSSTISVTVKYQPTAAAETPRMTAGP